MKLIKHLGDNRYEVEIDARVRKDYQEHEFGMVHDYFYVTGRNYLKNPDGSSGGPAIPVTVQVPIRAFNTIMLPIILADEYSQLDHLKDRNEVIGGAPKIYAPYAYRNVVIHFYDKIRKEAMTSILLEGEKHPNTVTRKFFNEFVAPNIKYK